MRQEVLIFFSFYILVSILFLLSPQRSARTPIKDSLGAPSTRQGCSEEIRSTGGGQTISGREQECIILKDAGRSKAFYVPGSDSSEDLRRCLWDIFGKRVLIYTLWESHLLASLWHKRKFYK